MIRSVVQALCALALLACSGPGGTGNDNGGDGGCPPGFEARGPACAPRFDDCSADGTRAVLGGGCEPLGVTACATGFVPTGASGCEPVLPAGDCPAGTLALLGETTCQPAGVATCGDGFQSDGAGGCDPVLPNGPCDASTLAIPGEATCRPVDPCGAAPWGDVVADATAIYVDADHPGPVWDGTAAHPLATIGEAVAVAPDGAQVVVAAGLYAEQVLITRPLRLVGRCSALVTIHHQTGAASDDPAVRIGVGGAGSSVRGVTLRGDLGGLGVHGAQDVTVESVRIQDTGGFGVELRAGARVRMSGVLVSGATDVGILVGGSGLELANSVVRDTRQLGGIDGQGLWVQPNPQGVSSDVSIHRSVVVGNHQIGVFSMGSHLRITDTVIHHTQPSAAGDYGVGIQTECDSAPVVCGTLELSRSVVANNTDAGAVLYGTTTTIVDSVVRDTAPSPNYPSGEGIFAAMDHGAGRTGPLTVSRSLVDGCENNGLAVLGVTTVVEQSIIRNTLPNATGDFGRGIESRCHPTTGECRALTVTRSLVANNRVNGIIAFGGELNVRSSVVRDTAPDATAPHGFGVAAQCDRSLGRCGSLTVEHTLISGNVLAGVGVVGTDARITGSVVQDTLYSADGLKGRGLEAQCDQALGVCGELRIEKSLFQRNRVYGLSLRGVPAVVVDTVVRGTLPDAEGEAGWGVAAICDPVTGDCAPVEVRGSLVSENVAVGIAIFGTDATVVSTIVRDTGSSEQGFFGRGINVQCQQEVGPGLDENACGLAVVERSLVARNHEMGVYVDGADLRVSASVVRDTSPATFDDSFGRGLYAQCSVDEQRCGRLAVIHSLVTDSHDCGISIYGVQTSLQGVAVRSTLPSAGIDFPGEFGQPLIAQCDEGTGACGTLDATDCLFTGGATAGVVLTGVSGRLARNAVAFISAQASDERYGYGVVIEGMGDPRDTVVDVTRCLIEGAPLAGLLLSGASGALHDSTIRDGQFSVVMGQGSVPEIGSDNTLSGLTESEPSWTNMDPCPAPPPALPMSLIE